MSTLLALTRRTTLAAALITLVSGCATVSTPANLADTIANTPALSTLNGLVTSAGLTETLKGTGPLTVFAPSNDAFKAVPAKTLETLAKDPAALKAVLTFHVIPSATLSANVKNAKVKTVNGVQVELSRAGDLVTIDSAVVTQADIVATNGVVHIIDTVLMPPKK